MTKRNDSEVQPRTRPTGRIADSPWQWVIGIFELIFHSL
jgi:hypothetical protein